MQTKLTRRIMLQKSATLALGSAFLMHAPARVFGSSQEKPSRVVLIRDKALLDASGNINQQVLSAMVDEGMVKLTRSGSPAEAWNRIIRPEDVLGIKTNYWDPLRTPIELENIIKAPGFQKSYSTDQYKAHAHTCLVGRGIAVEKLYHVHSAAFRLSWRFLCRSGQIVGTTRGERKNSTEYPRYDYTLISWRRLASFQQGVYMALPGTHTGI
jgi:hypothetical protein